MAGTAVTASLVSSVATVGNRLKQFREAAGLTQEQLADRTGISQGAISRIEKGITADPGLVLMASLAAALGQPITMFLPEEQTADSPATPARDRDVLDRMRQGAGIDRTQVSPPDDPLRLVADRVDSLTRIVLRVFSDQLTAEEKAHLEVAPNPRSQRSRSEGS